MEMEPRGAYLSKVPEVALGFWIIKIAATTLGETGGDALSMGLGLGYLTSSVFAGHAEPMRYAGVTMCLVFLLGLAALPLAPETKGVPLPD